MPLTLFKADNASEQTKTDLLRLETLIKSEHFLSGLFIGNKPLESNHGFTVITDIVLCEKQISWSSDIYDIKNEDERPYQRMADIIENESGRLNFEVLPKEQHIALDEQLVDPSLEAWEEISFPLFNKKYQAFNINTTLKYFQAKLSIDKKTAIWIYDEAFQSFLDAAFYMLIKAAYYTGFKGSPISERFLQAFETGGMPGGWVGATPENGGKAQDCVQLFHL